MATFRQIVAFRDAFERRGGAVLATAARVNDPDGEALLVNAGKAAKAVWNGLGWLTAIVAISS